MRNFHESVTGKLIDSKKLLKHWQKKLDFSIDEQNQDRKKLQSLGSHVQKIWSSFNENREKLDKYYMDSAQGVLAYSAGFLLSNIERVFSVLTKYEGVALLRSLFTENIENEEFIIADFGSGPLSASIGFLCALDALASLEPKIKLPKSFRILAIDRANKNVDFGFDLLKSCFFDPERLQLEKLSSVEKINHTVSFALCANIFNEIPEKHRIKALKTLYEKLMPLGGLVILEPGQEQLSKSLSTLRNEFILQGEDKSILAPCAHSKVCPLSRGSKRRDWCWFKHHWSPPESLRYLDKFTKIDHTELNYSYLLMAKRSQNNLIVENIFARVVSDIFCFTAENNKNELEYFSHHLVKGNKDEFKDFAENEKNIQKVLLCTKDGTLEAGLFAHERPIKRGHAIETDADFLFRSSERI